MPSVEDLQPADKPEPESTAVVPLVDGEVTDNASHQIQQPDAEVAKQPNQDEPAAGSKAVVVKEEPQSPDRLTFQETTLNQIKTFWEQQIKIKQEKATDPGRVHVELQTAIIYLFSITLPQLMYD